MARVKGGTSGWVRRARRGRRIYEGGMQGDIHGCTMPGVDNLGHCSGGLLREVALTSLLLSSVTVL